MPILISIGLWIALGLLGGRMFARKGYPGPAGVLIPVLLGPVAFVICFLIPSTAAAKRERLEEKKNLELSRRGERLKPCPRCERKCGGMATFCAGCNYPFEQGDEVDS